MFSRTLRILLSASLIFTAPVGMARSANSNVKKLNDNYVFLGSVASRVRHILAANLEYIKGIEECFLGLSQDSLCEKETQKVREGVADDFHTFHQHIFNNTLLFHIERFFTLYQRQASAYMAGREYEGKSLKRLFIRNWINPMSNAPNIVESQIPDIKYTEAEIQHFLGTSVLNITEREIVKDEMGEPVFDENGSVREKVKIHPYLYTLTGYMSKICNDMHNQIREKEALEQERFGMKPQYDLMDKDTRPICSEFRLSYTEKDGFKFLEPQFVQPGDSKFYYQLSNAARTKALSNQEPLLDRFYRLTGERPYLAFLKHGNPTDKELAEVFALLRQNATAALHEMRENQDMALGRDQAQLNRIKRDKMHTQMKRARRKLHTRYYSDENKKDLEENYPITDPINWGDHKTALQFMSYGPVVKEVLKDPSLAMDDLPNTDFSEVAGDLMEEYARDMAKKIGGDIAMAIGVTAACFLPFGKLFQAGKWLARTIKVGKAEVSLASLLCFAVTGAAVNTYFYLEASEIYDRTWQRVFASADGKVLLAEMEELSDAEFGLVLETLLWPVGVLGVREAFQLSKSLSRGSYQYLQKVRTGAH